MCLETFCSSFNIFYVCFAGKLSRIKNEEDCWKIVQKDNLQTPSFKRQSIGGDSRLQFRLMEKLGKIRQSVELRKGSAVRRFIDDPLYWQTVDLIRDSSITGSWRNSKDGATEGIDKP